MQCGGGIASRRDADSRSQSTDSWSKVLWYAQMTVRTAWSAVGQAFRKPSGHVVAEKDRPFEFANDPLLRASWK